VQGTPRLLLTSITGWLLVVFLATTIRRRSRFREVLQRAHFWAMITLTALVAVHIVLDSAALGTFKPRPEPAASARVAGPDRPVGVSSK
jgi:predicted small integral membrane protein